MKDRRTFVTEHGVCHRRPHATRNDLGVFEKRNLLAERHPVDIGHQKSGSREDPRHLALIDNRPSVGGSPDNIDPARSARDRRAGP